ncbi:hypothetical protein E2C01_078526 [Portunus trituberculatus]|uniref:Uncharacterized protein n=1 Tax=Portunus trituberculatus TaxID=210409 RepID=A0A5B7IT04_PORTR|nr:hypothetical protein [Portunus trituberculatus]
MPYIPIPVSRGVPRGRRHSLAAALTPASIPSTPRRHVKRRRTRCNISDGLTVRDSTVQRASGARRKQRDEETEARILKYFYASPLPF